MNHRSNIPKRRLVTACALIAAPLAVGVSACAAGSDGNPLASAPYDASAQVVINTDGDGGKVDPEKPLKVSTRGGEARITDVSAVDAAGRHVRGELSADGLGWRSISPLVAGTHYTASVSTENTQGEQGRRTVEFTTAEADAEKLGITFGPDRGTYGVGQPVVAELSHKVASPGQRRLVESALKVDSAPEVEGSWHWVDGKELHYRPRSYWPAHGSVTVRSDLKGLRIRDGLYGGGAEPLTLKFGDRVEAIADAGSKTMTVRRNGEILRTIPISAGKEGFRTRNGTKVVLGKEPFVRMTSESIGIASGSSESYDLPVRWATRLTWSGEYAHAAPWSAASQGAANTSHGCTGMSTEDAHWLFDQVRRGDLVTHVNTGGEEMAPFGNGFGDWNMPWKKWKDGSALKGAGGNGGGTGGGPAQADRLRPQV